VGVIPVESAHVMVPDKDGPYAMKQDPPIWAPFRKELAAADGFDGELRHLGRFPFYEAGGAPDVCLNVVTGEQQIWANLLLTIGVVR
jgi:L-fucose mutarotase